MRARIGSSLVRPRGSAAAVLLFAATAACSRGEEAQLSEAALRGKATYLNVCVACHNADPGRDGTLGPNLVGSTRELVEWRVVRGAYPPGYRPKRETNAMPAFPQLADRIDDLHAFIAEATRDGTVAK